MLSRLLPVAAVLAAFVLNLWTAPPSTSAKDAKVGPPACCEAKAACCAVPQSCCRDALHKPQAGKPLADDAAALDAQPTVARPTCCLKNAYCCRVRQACCR